MARANKTRASKQSYQSPNQLKLLGFDTPFEKNLKSDNRWVIMADRIPWDSLVNVYTSQLKNHRTGASSLNARVVIGSLIIKHMCDLSDRDTIQNIQENVYMQYFLGYSSFSNEAPFDASLFVEIRKRLGVEQINKINEQILGLHHIDGTAFRIDLDSNTENKEDGSAAEDGSCEESTPTHKGKLITDATACPQDIAYPTDLNLLNDARVKSESIIDELYALSKLEIKPRTSRRNARKDYLQTAQKKKKSKKVIRKAIKSQLSYLKRNLKTINRLLDDLSNIPLCHKSYRYLLVIKTLYDQQQYMYDNKVHRVDHRIVSIHQPHVRPIVRGKANSNVEFGSKIQVSLMQGYAFLDELSWDAFNEGSTLMDTVDKYKKRFAYYPEEVLVDKIYCTRANRKALKILGIKLRAKPLGRPRKEEPYKVTPGERNPIEGKFGQAKTAYGLNRIKARLRDTSESWIATIVLVLNLVKLTKEALLCLLFRRPCSTFKSVLDLLMQLKMNEEKVSFLKLSNQPFLIHRLLTY